MENTKSVILIHGLINWKWIFIPLQRTLRQHAFLVHYFNYSPRTDGVVTAARKLATVTKGFSLHKLYFVTHSMGALVLRALSLHIGKNSNLVRAVMIAPPNQGALMMQKVTALKLPGWNFITKCVYGRARIELLPGSAGIASDLPSPPCEFAIIAGGKNTPRGFSPFLPGDNDGTITVDSTRLDGASDFIVLPHLHTPILWQRDTIDATINFLLTGKFNVSPLSENKF